MADEPATPADPAVKPADFPDLSAAAQDKPVVPDFDLVRDIPVTLQVELGRTEMMIQDVLELTPGKVIELDRLAGEPLDILINGKLLAKGEVVVVDENFGIRLTSIVDPATRQAAAKEEPAA